MLAVLSIGSLALHFVLDCIPHGFITAPWSIFKKLVPTLAELVPGPLILLAAILVFGHPLLFMLAAACSLIPDVCTTLVWKEPRIVGLFPMGFLHRLHRKVHWFETDNPDGSVTHRFANGSLLAAEACFVILLLGALFLFV